MCINNELKMRLSDERNGRCGTGTRERVQASLHCSVMKTLSSEKYGLCDNVESMNHTYIVLGLCWGRCQKNNADL
jgi:hypothetical protein